MYKLQVKCEQQGEVSLTYCRLQECNATSGERGGSRSKQYFAEVSSVGVRNAMLQVGERGSRNKQYFGEVSTVLGVSNQAFLLSFFVTDA
jgi:hypothetical protein